MWLIFGTEVITRADFGVKIFKLAEVAGFLRGA
jgi:hypothetical protein